MALGAFAAPAAAVEPVRVSVDPARAGPVVGGRFIGLSFEASALPAMARNARRGNLVTLLRSIGPGMLRFGGSSVDTNTAFSADGEAPPWATTTITPRDFDGLAALARRTGWRVLLALPLGHYDPRAAAREAAAAARRLGPSLAAFEIGNEPNTFWLSGLRPPTYDYLRYRSEIRAYRRAIGAAVPGIPIAGPDTAHAGGFGWLSAFAHDERPALLTPHHYPLHVCGGTSPTVAELLSPSLADHDARTIGRFAAIGRANGVPVRIGETNNVGCRGHAGVSDTFAAALWALRYMLTIARAGVSGVTFHTLPDDCGGYSAICAPSETHYRRGRLQAMPEWYALLLFRELAGARLARVSLSHRPPGLTVGAFGRGSGAVDVLAVNTTPDAPARFAIRIARGGDLRSGKVLSLRAPALDATTRVRLGGAGVSRRGVWRPGRRQRRVSVRAGAVRLAMPGGSAALLRVR
jgi:hypothetical protein